MEQQKNLGIYLRKDTASVVCLGKEQGVNRVFDAFTVSIEDKEEKNFQSLLNLVAEGCKERQIDFSQVAVALDCSLSMQHKIHSEFTDPKQINQTIRFDTEEVLTMDATDTAIAFTINSAGEDGSDLSVFTAKHHLLSDVITALQSNKMDPVTIEPDVSCLTRYISEATEVFGGGYSLFAILSKHNSYYISGSPEGAESEPFLVRSSIISNTTDRTAFLQHEIPVTIAFYENEEKITKVKVYDSAGSVNYEKLAEQTSIELGNIDILKAAGIDPKTAEKCEDKVALILACGAAMAPSDKQHIVNFRADFMPYQGKKQRLQKAVKFLSLSVSVLLVALGVYLQLQLFEQNNYLNKVNERFGQEYSTVMMGASLPQKESPPGKLTRELRRVESLKSGRLSVTGEKSVTTKLTLVLAAFNECAAQTDLKIDSIKISTNNIIINGSTSSITNTLKLRKAIEENELMIQKDSLDPKGGRGNFRITIKAKS